MSFIVAQKNCPSGLLLIVTDEDILGKSFEEGKRQLDLRQGFYQGKKLRKEEVRILFGQAQHLHLTGKQAVALAVEEELISPRNILWIGGIPHAEAVLD